MAEFSLPEVFAEIELQAKALGLNPTTAKALAVAENTGSGSITGRKSYSTDAVSPAGALGLMQVMPATALGLQKAGYLPADWKHDPNDLRSNIQAGLAAFKEKTTRMNNPDDLGELASVYNGSSATHRAYKSGRLDQLPAETKQYTEKLRRATMELGGAPVNNPSAFTATPSTPGAGTSSRSSTSTRTTTYDPLQYDAFMSDIMGAVGTGGVFDQTAQVLQEQAQNRNFMSADLVKAVAQQGVAAGDKAVAEATTLAAGQAKRAAILGSLNLDPAATGNEMTKAFDTVNSTDAMLGTLKPEIDRRMAVGFFDNPLEWLVNQTRLPGMVAEYNGIVGTQNDAINRYKNLSGIASNQQSITQSTEADLIAKQGQAVANAAAAEAAVKAKTIELATAPAKMQDALTMAQLTGQKLNLQGQALNLTRQSITESSGESERTAAAKAEQDTINKINAVLVAAGGSPMSVAQFKQMPAAKKEVLLSNATSSTFGKDFAESFSFIWNDGNRQNMATGGAAAVTAWLNGTVSQAGTSVSQEEKSAQAKGQKFDAKKALPAKLNEMQAIYEQEAATNMRTASKFNPFKIDYATAAKDPALANNGMAIWLNQYGPTGKEPMMQTVDEEFVIKKFASGVQAGQYSAADATKQITDFYKVATAKQQEATKWNLFGMSKPEKTYPVQITGVGTGNTKLDLGNPSQVENALTRKVAYDTAVKLSLEQSAFPIRQIFGFGE